MNVPNQHQQQQQQQQQQQSQIVGGGWTHQLLISSGLLYIGLDGIVRSPDMNMNELLQRLESATRAVVHAQTHIESPSNAPSPPSLRQAVSTGTESPSPSNDEYTITTIAINLEGELNDIFPDMTEQEILNTHVENLNGSDLAIANNVSLYTCGMVVDESQSTASHDEIKKKKTAWKVSSRISNGYLRCGCKFCMSAGIINIITDIDGEEVGRAIITPQSLQLVRDGVRKVKLHMLECPSVPEPIKTKIREGFAGGSGLAIGSDVKLANIINALPFGTSTPLLKAKRRKAPPKLRKVKRARVGEMDDMG